MRMSLSAVPLTLALSVAVVPSPATAGDDSTVTIVNNSSFDLHRVFVSPAAEDHWGPDQLGEHVVAADGGTFRLVGIPCAEYDVKVVDHDGDVCVVEGVHLCDDDDVWNVSDEDLLECEGFVLVDDEDADDYDDGDQ